MKTKKFLAIAAVSAFVLVISAMPAMSKNDATIVGTYLDDFCRTTLAATATVTLSDGTSLYWNGMGKGTFSIQDSVMIAVCDSFAYYRFATSGATAYPYCIFRMKGDARAKNNRVYVRIAGQPGTDTLGISDNGGVSERLMDTLVGPDSLPVPAISTDWQVFVVDMKKNGLSFGGKGNANAFQIGTHAQMELDIDYIFSSRLNPLDTTSGVRNFFVGNSANKAAQANVWISGTSSSIKIRTNRTNTDAGLTLYNLQGKMVRSFTIHGQASEIQIPAGSLMSNVYLYTVSELSGNIFAKGKVSLR
jgi:hypothetical protein